MSNTTTPRKSARRSSFGHPASKASLVPAPRRCHCEALTKMPAPRPDHDALAVWLCVNAEFGDGGLKSAFGALHDRMRPHALRRGVGPSIDTKDGGVAGDKMAEATIKNLYHQAQRRMAKDERLQARMILHSAQLRAALDKAP